MSIKSIVGRKSPNLIFSRIQRRYTFSEDPRLETQRTPI